MWHNDTELPIFHECMILFFDLYFEKATLAYKIYKGNNGSSEETF